MSLMLCTRVLFALLLVCPVALICAVEPTPDDVAASDAPHLQVGLGDWPMWGRSRYRNSVATAEGIPAEWNVGELTGGPARPGQRNIKWMAHLGTTSYGNPIVANGRVYVGTNNGHGYVPRFPRAWGAGGVDLGCLIAFDEQTGKFLWQHSSEKLPIGRAWDWPDQGICSSPVVDGDRLWLVTNRCEVLCLDAEGFHDGENDGAFQAERYTTADDSDIIWTFDMIGRLGVSPHNMSSCSPLIAGDSLFVCTSNGVDESHSNLPAPKAPSFLAMNRHTGDLLWTDNSPGINILHAQWASPSYGVFDGQPQVIFPGGDGWLYSFDPAGDGQGDSRLLWKFDCNPKTALYSVRGKSSRNHMIGFPAIYEGLVYIAVGEDPEHGEGNGHLWCIDPTKKLDGSDVSSELAVDAAGRILAPRRLQAVNEKNGERAIPNPDSAVVWHFTGSDASGNGKLEYEEEMHRSLGTAAIQDDILYMADFSGEFHCLNAKTGEPYWNYDMLSQCWGSALIVDQKVFVGNEYGKMLVFAHSSDAVDGLPAGGPLAEIEMQNSVFMTPVVANGVLFVATKDWLYAIEQREPDGDEH